MFDQPVDLLGGVVQEIGEFDPPRGPSRVETLRHHAVFDKFLPFAQTRSVFVWNGVSANLLTKYADHLEATGYAHKTLVNKLTMLKQPVKWLIKAGHLQSMKRIEWLGHADREMIRHYYHLHDKEAKRRMDSLDLLGGVGGRSASQTEGNDEQEDVEPTPTEMGDNGEPAD
jgi:hypothetical protein